MNKLGEEKENNNNNEQVPVIHGQSGPEKCTHKKQYKYGLMRIRLVLTVYFTNEP